LPEDHAVFDLDLILNIKQKSRKENLALRDFFLNSGHKSQRVVFLTRRIRFGLLLNSPWTFCGKFPVWLAFLSRMRKNEKQ